MAQTYSRNERLGGTNFLDVDGVTFLLGEDFEWSPSTPERETAKGMSGVYGYVEKPRQGHMKGTAYDYGTNDIAAIGNIAAKTLTASLANGKVVTLRTGWNIEPPVVDTAKGTFTFNVESGTVTEQAA